MTRYFYTDPLAAAWMAKHFGMRFVNGGKRIPPVTYSFLHNDVSGYRLRYFIHADSTPLLEPQIGDLLTSGETIRNSIAVATIADLERCCVGIIQRSGKVFMWPEVDHG